MLYPSAVSVEADGAFDPLRFPMSPEPTHSEKDSIPYLLPPSHDMDPFGSFFEGMEYTPRATSHYELEFPETAEPLPGLPKQYDVSIAEQDAPTYADLSSVSFSTPVQSERCLSPHSNGEYDLASSSAFDCHGTDPSYEPLAKRSRRQYRDEAEEETLSSEQAGPSAAFSPYDSVESTSHHIDSGRDEDENEESWYRYYYEMPDPQPNIVAETLEFMEKINEKKNEAEMIFEMTLAEIKEAELTRKARLKGKPRHWESESKIYVCVICSRGFHEIDEMQKHIVTAHLKQENKYRCPHCPRAFKLPKNLSAHVAKHKTVGTVFSCVHCPQVYRTNASLERHLSDKHGVTLDGDSVSKSHSCSTCFKSFGLEKELKVHERYCVRREQILMSRAKKRLSSASSATPAAPSGRPIKDKSCPVCQLVCASVQSRNRHIMRAHPDQKELAKAPVGYVGNDDLAVLPFVCEVCTRGFSDAAKLSIHKRREHDADSSKTFGCEKCGRKFPLLSELRKHELRMAGLPMCRNRGRQLPTAGPSAPSTPSLPSLPASSPTSSAKTPTTALKRNDKVLPASSDDFTL